MNINKALDKAWETKTFKEIAKAPVAALEGVSDSDAKILREAFSAQSHRSQWLRWLCCL